MALYESLERVDGPDTFLQFARELVADRQKEVGKPIDMFGRGENGWENHSIEDFLDAAISWAEDSDFGASPGSPGDSPWKTFAEFLYCGKIYE